MMMMILMLFCDDLNVSAMLGSHVFCHFVRDGKKGKALVRTSKELRDMFVLRTNKIPQV